MSSPSAPIATASAYSDHRRSVMPLRVSASAIVGPRKMHRVTHDIPEGVVAAGNPCRVIREIAGQALARGSAGARLGGGEALQVRRVVGLGEEPAGKR